MDKFFAFLYRTKYINRWGLMRNTEKENLMEHSFLTAVVAHALAEISNALFGNRLDAERCFTTSAKFLRETCPPR